MTWEEYFQSPEFREYVFQSFVMLIDVLYILGTGTLLTIVAIRISGPVIKLLMSDMIPASKMSEFIRKQREEEVMQEMERKNKEFEKMVNEFKKEVYEVRKEIRNEQNLRVTKRKGKEG